ncbi:MAG: arginine N-succinyltransferase [Parvularculaceae bacterium]
MSYPFMRPVTMADLPAVHALALQAGGGMTNLPASEATLKEKLSKAVASFGANASKPGGEFYMLVLDIGGRAMGTAAVFASIGEKYGFVNYKINREFYYSEPIKRRIERDVMVPTHDFTDCAEVGSLFISAEARGGGLGRLLARARYMFIAQSPKIIADPVCAELRGWRAPDGAQPFWNAVGRRFFGMDFEEADAYNAAFGNQFIEDLMPRYPIYVDMLPDDARQCLGRPHESAEPALKMLKEEGFSYNNYIDVFDGGPLVDARQAQIRTIRQSKIAQIAAIEEKVDGPDLLLATGATARFRSTRAKAIVDGDRLTLSRAAATALNVEPGAELRWAKW